MPLWDMRSEQYFAEAFVEHSIRTAKPTSPFHSETVPVMEGRPPMTDEMMALISRYLGDVSDLGNPPGLSS